MGTTKKERAEALRYAKDQKKKCIRCKKIKLFTEFSARAGKEKKWFQSRCKACMSIIAIEWANKNKEKYSAYQSKYHKENVRRRI